MIRLGILLICPLHIGDEEWVDNKSCYKKIKIYITPGPQKFKTHL